MNFQEYLLSKKIDSDAFKASEDDLWEEWNREFDQISPTGFTAQKLFLINPIRRKYPAKAGKGQQIPVIQPPTTVPVNPVTAAESTLTPTPENKPVLPKPAVPRPVFKPKPKTT